MALVNQDRITISNNGSDTGRQRIVNFIPGTGISFTITDNPGSERVDTTISVNSASSPTFAGLTLSGMTQGSVIFAGTGGLLSQDNSNFFFDDTNNYLGIGTNAPASSLHVLRASTATSGTINNGQFQGAPDPTSASSATYRAGDFTNQLGNTGTTNVTGTIMGARYLTGNSRQTGTLTTMLGLQLQAINGVVFGASSGTALTTTIQAAIFQAINNSQTAGAISEITGGIFTGEQRGTGGATTTTQQAGLFNILVAGGTTTSLYGARVRTSNAFGSTLTGGTITNAYLGYFEGFPAGPTYTNTPHQIYLEAGATAAIALRQLGASNNNRFVGPAMFGNDSNAAAQVEIKKAAGSGTQTPSFLVTGPAHTSLTASTESNDVYLNLNRTVTWAPGNLTTQRAVYIAAPTYTIDVLSTIDTMSTVAISGPPAAGNVNVTNSYGLLIDTRNVTNSVNNAIGLVVKAPTGSIAVNSAATFDGTVGVGTYSPKAFLDVKVPTLSSTLNNVTCIDGGARYTGMYVGGTALTSVPGSGTSGFLLDFGWAPTSNVTFSVAANQTFMYLQGGVNTTGTVRGILSSFLTETTAGTATAINNITAATNLGTLGAGAGAVTNARGFIATNNFSGTGAVTTYTAYDTTFTFGNVAGSTATTIGYRVQTVSKGASYTLTDFVGVQIDEQTATFGGVKIAIYEKCTSCHNRILGQTKFGADATPTRMVDINGGLSINSSGSVVNLTADNQVVTVGDRSYIRLSSDNATAGNRTFVLTQSTRDGHILVLEWTGTNAAELVDDSAQNGGGNHRLSATWTPTQYDTLTLISNGTDWVEMARSTN